MNNRNQNSVARLAKSNFTAALEFANTIPEVGKRIQSLGWVARYAPDARVRSIVDSALKLAKAPTDDPYAGVQALAWPLRALHEKNQASSISRVLREAVELSQDVMPTSSRAEALGLLIQAVLPAGIERVSPAIDALLAYCSNDDHWRIVRAFGNTALVVNGFDKQRAKKIANAMPVGNKRDAILTQIEAGETLKVRAFFW